MGVGLFNFPNFNIKCKDNTPNKNMLHATRGRKIYKIQVE